MTGISVTVLEITAIALIAGTLLDIGLSLYGNVRRCAHDATRRQAALTAFRELAAANLSSARAEQERTELSWRGHRKFRVVQRIPEGESICSFVLKPHDGGQIAPFLPGQHLTFDVGEAFPYFLRLGAGASVTIKSNKQVTQQQQ